MAGQPDSKPSAPDLFDCYDANGTHVRCVGRRTGENIAIRRDDIVCFLPHDHVDQDERGGYKLLHLQYQHSEPFAGIKGSVSLQAILVASVLPEILSCHLYRGLPEHLDLARSPNLRIHVVISTLSGVGSAGCYFEDVVRPFFSHIGASGYQVHRTSTTGSIIKLCHETFIPSAREGLPQTIVFLSGDGGIVDTIDSFYKSPENMHTAPGIALIPMGTGNAMASSLGLLAHPAAGLANLLWGAFKPMPAFAALFSPGAQYITHEGSMHTLVKEDPSTGSGAPVVYGGVVASWGMHASLVADSDTAEYRRYGAERFKMAAKELLFPSDGGETHRYVGKVTLTKRDGQTGGTIVEVLGSNDHMYVLAALVPKLEKDFVVSPKSVPLDGSLRLVHFGSTSPDNAMRLMGYAYQEGRHVHEESVTYAEIEKLRIDFHEPEERWRRVCIDGRVVAVEDGGWLEVCKESRRLLTLLAPTDLVASDRGYGGTCVV